MKRDSPIRARCWLPDSTEGRIVKNGFRPGPGYSDLLRPEKRKRPFFAYAPPQQQSPDRQGASFIMTNYDPFLRSLWQTDFPPLPQLPHVQECTRGSAFHAPSMSALAPSCANLQEKIVATTSFAQTRPRSTERDSRAKKVACAAAASSISLPLAGMNDEKL